MTLAPVGFDEHCGKEFIDVQNGAENCHIEFSTFILRFGLTIRHFISVTYFSP